MAQRLELQALLEDLLGSRQVYFQEPENFQMEFPAIVYALDYRQTDHADNNPYLHHKRYLVTVIDSDPDSEIPDKVAALPKCAFDRKHVKDKLHHHSFRLFF